MRKLVGFVLISLLILAGTNFNKVKKRVYNELYLIMTPQEQKQFKSINTPVQLKMFLEEFWKKRDPDPKTPQNKIRDIYYARLKFAAKHFKEPGRPGWLSDRGKIFLILGPPTSRYTKYMGDKSTIQGSSYSGFNEDSVALAGMSGTPNVGNYGGVNKESWVYENLHLNLAFIDRLGTGKFVLEAPPPKLLNIFEKYKKNFLPRKRRTQSLHLSAEVDTKAKKFYIHVPINELSFLKENGKIFADIVLEFSYTNAKTEVEKHFTQEMKFEVKEKDINDPEKRITIPINIAPLKGMYIINITIKDKVSKAKGVKRYKLKI